MVKNLPDKQETQVPPLSQEDPLEKEMATHSGIFAWGFVCLEASGRLSSIGSQRLRRDLATEQTHNRIL